MTGDGCKGAVGQKAGVWGRIVVGASFLSDIVHDRK